MKRVFHDYGAMIVTVIAVVALIGLTVFLMRPGSVMANAFSAITGQFVDAADEMIDGAGNGGNGGSGEGAGETALGPGLYDASDNLITPWDDLVANGTIIMTGGVVSTNVDMDAGVNNSSDALTGKLVLSSDVTSIADYGLVACTGLTGIEITDSVTSIGVYAFGSCTSLTSITFGCTVAELNAIAFGINCFDDVPATQVVCSDGTAALS